MSIKLGFGILDEKPSTGESELLPAGWYNGYITSLEIVHTKNKNGKILKAVFSVLSGYYKGISIIENFNIFNQNETAQRIARAELSAIGVALGIQNGEDAEILLRKPLKFKVKIESFTNKDGEIKFSNRTSGYRSISEQIDTIEVKTDIEYPVSNETSKPVQQVNSATPAWNVPPIQNVESSPTWQQPPLQQPVVQQPVVPEILGSTPPVQPWAQPVETKPVQQPQPEGFDPNKKPAWMQQT